MAKPTDRQRGFIRSLALYLCGEEGRKSIELEMGNRWAQEWAAVRANSPLLGYHTVEQAERILTVFLLGEKPARAKRKDR